MEAKRQAARMCSSRNVVREGFSFPLELESLQFVFPVCDFRQRAGAPVALKIGRRRCDQVDLRSVHPGGEAQYGIAQGQNADRLAASA